MANSGRALEFGSWDRGNFLDRWSVLHVFWGALYALVFRLIGLNKMQSFVFMLVIAIGWEIYERYAGVLEPLPNSILDIILNVVGFALIYYFMPMPRFTAQAITVIVLALAIAIVKYLSRR